MGWVGLDSARWRSPARPAGVSAGVHRLDQRGDPVVEPRGRSHRESRPGGLGGGPRLGSLALAGSTSGCRWSSRGDVVTASRDLAGWGGSRLGSLALAGSTSGGVRWRSPNRSAEGSGGRAAGTESPRVETLLGWLVGLDSARWRSPARPAGVSAGARRIDQRRVPLVEPRGPSHRESRPCWAGWWVSTRLAGARRLDQRECALALAGSTSAGSASTGRSRRRSSPATAGTAGSVALGDWSHAALVDRG